MPNLELYFRSEPHVELTMSVFEHGDRRFARGEDKTIRWTAGVQAIVWLMLDWALANGSERPMTQGDSGPAKSVNPNIMTEWWREMFGNYEVVREKQRNHRRFLESVLLGPESIRIFVDGNQITDPNQLMMLQRNVRGQWAKLSRSRGAANSGLRSRDELLSALGGRTCLVVENDGDLALHLASVLAGYRCRLERPKMVTRVATMDLIEEIEHIDFALIDLMIPEHRGGDRMQPEGLKLLQPLRNKFPQAVLIGMSQFTREQVEQFTLGYATTDFLALMDHFVEKHEFIGESSLDSLLNLLASRLADQGMDA